MRRSRARIAAAVVAAMPPTLALAGYNPTNEEQFTLELINRTRLEPDREVYRLRAPVDDSWGENPLYFPGTSFPKPQVPSLNEGLAAGTISSASKQPLAFNTALIQSARDYSQVLIDNSAFEHEYGGTTPQTRDEAAGYVFTPGWSYGENLALTAYTDTWTINQTRAAEHHEGLFIDADVPGRGHRTNVMNPSWKEIGIGFAEGPDYYFEDNPNPYNAIISSYEFAYSAGSASGKPFITGVVTSDSVSDNNFYDVGEGLNAVTVTVTQASNGAAVKALATFSTGGFTIDVPANGNYNVTFSGGGLASPITYHNVAVGTTNVKLDAATDMGVWNSTNTANWSSAAAWTGAAPNSVGANAVFAGKITAPTSVTVDTGRTVGSILFRSAQQYTLAASGANRLTLDMGTAPARIDVQTGSHNIAAPIQLNDALEVSVVNSADTLTMSGAISGTNRTITKFGKGLLALGGNSTWSGGLFVNDGPVYLQHGSALGSGTATIGWEGNSAGLYINTAGITVANNLIVNSGAGSRELGAILNSGSGTFSGSVSMNANLRLYAATGATVNFSGALNDGTNTLGVTIPNTGVVVLSSNSNAYNGPTTVQNGTLRVAGSIASSSGVTVNNTASLEVASTQTLTSLTLNNTSKAKLVGTNISLKTPSLSRSTTASVDLTANGLVVDWSGATVYSTIKSAVINAYNPTNAAHWTSPGITSSTAAGTPTTHGVGYAEASKVLALSGTSTATWMGNTVDSTSVLARYTLLGDADLSGTVNFFDLTALAALYGSAGDWSDGDFDYNGTVNFFDLTALAANYGLALPSEPVPGATPQFNADLAAAFASVPEPAGIGLIAIAGAAALARRRRRRHSI